MYSTFAAHAAKPEEKPEPAKPGAKPEPAKKGWWPFRKR